MADCPDIHKRRAGPCKGQGHGWKDREHSEEVAFEMRWKDGHECNRRCFAEGYSRRREQEVGQRREGQGLFQEGVWSSLAGPRSETQKGVGEAPAAGRAHTGMPLAGVGGLHPAMPRGWTASLGAGVGSKPLLCPGVAYICGPQIGAGLCPFSLNKKEENQARICRLLGENLSCLLALKFSAVNPDPESSSESRGMGQSLRGTHERWFLGSRGGKGKEAGVMGGLASCPHDGRCPSSLPHEQTA